MLTVPVDIPIFRQILEHLWSNPESKILVTAMVHEVINKEGPFVDFLFKIRGDIRMIYLNNITEFLNSNHAKDDKKQV